MNGGASNMAVPDYQRLMLPLLRSAADRQEHTIGEVTELLAREFALSEEDRRELLPSGRQQKFDNRVQWACTYLKKAGLLESVGRGRFRITARGAGVLASNPGDIDNRFLEQFAEFVEFRSASRSSETRPRGEEETAQTPEELLEASYQTLTQQLAQDLLSNLKDCPPRFFEKLVVDLLLAMGYGGSRKDAGQAIGRTGDGGIDGVIKEDRLGLDIVYIQAKRWQGNVPVSVVREFAGSLEAKRASKGVLITTSGFAQGATDYVNTIHKTIVLIDGQHCPTIRVHFQTVDRIRHRSGGNCQLPSQEAGSRLL